MERRTIDLGSIADATVVWNLKAFADSLKHRDPYSTLLLRAQGAFAALDVSWQTDMEPIKKVDAIEWMGCVMTREFVRPDAATEKDGAILTINNDGTGYRSIRKIDVTSDQ